MPRKVTTNDAPDAAASAATSVQVETMLPVRKRPAESATRPEKPSQPRSRARVPRITRLMALAIKFQGMIERGELGDYADIARLGYVTPARVTQIMNLLLLAPEIQEMLLFPAFNTTISERRIRIAVGQVHWASQRAVLSAVEGWACSK